MDIEGLTLPVRERSPPLEHAFGLGDHQGGETGYAPAVERRLHEAPLAAPEVALAREQALAHDQLHRLVVFGLDVVAVVCSEDMADVVRVVEEDRAAVQVAEAHHRAVLLGRREQEPEWLPRSSLAEEHPGWRQPGAGGQLTGLGFFGLDRHVPADLLSRLLASRPVPPHLTVRLPQMGCASRWSVFNGTKRQVIGGSS